MRHALSLGVAAALEALRERDRRDEALDVASRWRARVNGSLCGDSAFGLWSGDSMELQALADYVAFGEANDGAVPLGGEGRGLFLGGRFESAQGFAVERPLPIKCATPRDEGLDSFL